MSALITLSEAEARLTPLQFQVRKARCLLSGIRDGVIYEPNGRQLPMNGDTAFAQVLVLVQTIRDESTAIHAALVAQVTPLQARNTCAAVRANATRRIKAARQLSLTPRP